MNPDLQSWIVPKKIIQAFINKASSAFNLYPVNVIEHDQYHYLVITHGSYPFIENELNMLLGEKDDE